MRHHGNNSDERRHNQADRLSRLMLSTLVLSTLMLASSPAWSQAANSDTTEAAEVIAYKLPVRR